METLETSFGTFNVYVNQITSPEESLIHISFVDKTGKTHMILMRPTNAGLAYVNSGSIPHWILSLREQFNALVTREILRTYQASVA